MMLSGLVLLAFACSSPILEEGAGIERVVSGCKFTEGPALGPDGAIYFSDQPNDRILKIDTQGQVSVVLSPCGAANGLAFDRFGNMLMCQSSRPGGARALARYSFSQRKLETLVNNFNGSLLIAPNDLCIDRWGRVYFTDPFYAGERSQPTSGVYRYDLDGTVTKVIASLLKPNGIALSPNGQLLYVSDRGTQKLHHYAVQIDGSLASLGVLYDFGDDRGIDGMCLDTHGNIYGAAGQGETTGLFVISPQGELLLHQPMPEFSTNVTFGGPDLRTLYLTASTSVYKLRTESQGLRPLHRRPHQVFAAPPRLRLQSNAGEGPAWSPQLGLLFSGGGCIHRWIPGTRTPKLLESGHPTNGLLLNAAGQLYRCENSAGRVTRREQDGSITVLTDQYDGQRYNQPNDLTLDLKGRLFFSDPKYGPRTDIPQRDSTGKPIEGVYRIDASGNVQRVITHEVDRPNGVLATSDDRYLFVADNNNNTANGARKLWRFEFDSEGELKLESRRLIYNWGTGRGPDGMVQDQAGHIYVAAGLNHPNPPYETVEPENRAGIYVFKPDGQLIDFVSIPRDEVTNCTFGGKDLKTLYVTAGGTLWEIRTVHAGALPINTNTTPSGH